MQLLNVNEAAERLAISSWTVRALIRAGKLRPIRVGRLVRLDEAEIEQFIGNAKVNPTTQHGNAKEEQL